MPFDAIIIGSGFGGAVTACRLAEKGMKVLVLERGRRWGKATFPSVTGKDWLWDNNDPASANGWLDLRHFPHISVAQGAAVGGGSLIYANISAVPPANVFDDGWPAEITYKELEPHYKRVADFMNIQEVPDNQLTDRSKVVRLGAEKIGEAARFRKLTLAVSFDPEYSYNRPDPHNPSHSKTFVNKQGATQGTCIHAGVCDVGCPVLAKNTLDLNYLYWAENRHGAEVRPLHLVTNIKPISGGGGYTVSFQDLASGRSGHEQARIAVVAAGSLGSTELLLRCRSQHRSLPKISRFLGHSWSSNGDFLTPALNTTPLCSPTKGPTISAAIDFGDGSMKGPDGRPLYFWIQDGGIPDVVLPMLERKFDSVLKVFGAQHLIDELNKAVRSANPLSHVMPWFAQGRDAANGRLSMRRPWWVFGKKRLHLKWDLKKSEETMFDIIDLHRRLARETGGTPLTPPSWLIGRRSRFTRFINRFGRHLVTPHALGGCNMGTDVHTGVVNHAGEVFNYPGLYVIDGAIVPEAVGVNPSRTIAALAERVAGMIGARG